MTGRDEVVALDRERIAALERVVEPLRGHDSAFLLAKARWLKQADAEAWAIGELVERALAALDALDGAGRECGR